jgi:hypothetical protein
MGYRIGSGFVGTNAIKTSTANVEIIQTLKPTTYPKNTFEVYKISFMNDQACTVKINGGNSIYLRALQGFETDVTDKEIYSFVIVEAGITYSFVAAYGG